MGNITGNIRRKGRLGAVLALLAVSLAGAGVLISPQYRLSLPGVVNGGANTASSSYLVQNGTLGQTLTGSAQSANYVNSGGFAGQAAAMANPPAADLSDAYVYPNPFKPNSPGSFQADRLTFKHLPAEATIRIFEITGRKVAELHKADTTTDQYEWSVTNSGGHKLASGVYIYYMTAPGGGKARGKFAVIR